MMIILVAVLLASMVNDQQVTAQPLGTSASLDEGLQKFQELYQANKPDEAMAVVDGLIKRFANDHQALYKLRYNRALGLESLDRNIECLVELIRARSEIIKAGGDTKEVETLIDIMESKLERLNHFGIMQLKPSASLEELNKAHKRMQLLLHPDKQSGLDELGKRVVAGLYETMRASYEYLSEKMGERGGSSRRMTPSATSTTTDDVDLSLLDIKAIRRPYLAAIKQEDWTKAMQTLNWIISELSSKKLDDKTMKTMIVLYLDKARVYGKLNYGVDALEWYKKARELATILMVPIEPLESVVRSL